MNVKSKEQRQRGGNKSKWCVPTVLNKQMRENKRMYHMKSLPVRVAGPDASLLRTHSGLHTATYPIPRNGHPATHLQV